MKLPPAPSPPAYWHVPDGSIFTIADEVLDLMPEIGYEVGEPERLFVRALLPQRPNGRWAGLQAAGICARQNIKTASMIASAIHDTFVQDLDVVWTAHEFKTSADAFKDFQAIIEGNDDLAREVLRVRTANGSEGYDLRSGATLRIIARSGRSGRGFSKVPRLYLDEGLYLDGKMLGAITPTMAAIDNAHLVIGSSPGILTSDVLREIRARGRLGEDQDLGYVEWTSERVLTPTELRLPASERPATRPRCRRADCTHAPGSAGCALDDEDAWHRANPALDRRISREFLRNQRKVLAGPGIPEFMREHMGWWEDPPEAGVDDLRPITLDAWKARSHAPITGEVTPDARIAFAVDQSWDRSTSYIAAAVDLGDGRRHAEIMATGFGNGWVVDWLDKRIGKWSPTGVLFQGTSAPISAIRQRLESASWSHLVEPVTGADIAAAFGALIDATTAETLCHLEQPQVDAGIERGTWKTFGSALIQDRASSPVDVAPTTAMALAVWRLMGDDDAPPNVW